MTTLEHLAVYAFATILMICWLSSIVIKGRKRNRGFREEIEQRRKEYEDWLDEYQKREQT